MSSNFNSGDHVVDHVDDCLHGLLSAVDDAYVREHAAECPICAVAMSEARQRLDALRLLPVPELSPQLLTATLERVNASATAQHQRMTSSRRWALRAVVAALTLVAMVHLHLANQRPSAYDLRLLGQRELIAGTPASLRAQLVRNDKPVEGASVTFSLFDKKTGRSIQLASYTTDAHGTGSPRFQLPDWPEGSYTLMTVATAGFHAETITEAITLKRASRVMLSTDKPVYQPGQTIHMRALALRRPDFQPVAGQEALFLIADPAGNIILKQPAVTSAFGLASADCPLATEILEGDYTLTCRVGNAGTGGGATESKSTVEVKRYTLPKFKIALVTDKSFYAPGDRVLASIQADYFFGQPLQSARVDLAAATTDAAALTLASTSAATDVLGRASLEFVLPSTLPGTQPDDGSARLALTLTVKDTASQIHSRTFPLVITTRPIHIEVLPESGQLVGSLPNRVFLLTTYADGRPARTNIAVAGHGTFATSDLGVAVLEVTPREETLPLTVSASDAAGLSSSHTVTLSTSANPASDYLVRTDKALYKAGETLNVSIFANGPATSAANAPVFIDLLKDGQTLRTTTLRLTSNKGVLPIDLTADLAGTLQLRTYRFDADGFPVRKTRLVYVQPADDLTISATLDHAQYRPGETARVNLRLTDKSGNPKVGALSLAAVDEAVFSVLPRGGSQTGTEKAFFTLDPQLLQPVYTAYPYVAFGSMDAQTDLAAQALFTRTIDTVSSRDALLQRLIARGDINPRQLRYMDTEWGRRALEERVQESDLPARQKEILLGNDGISLDARTGPVNSARAESLKRTRERLIPPIWIIVLILSGVTLMWVHSVPRIIEILVVLAIISVLIAILLPSLGKARELSNRSVTSANARSLVESLEAANKDDATLLAVGETAASAPRLRQFFPETLLWRPELITDANGAASFELPLADSITTWRLSTSAITSTGELSALQTPIKVFQPFFIELNVPPALTRNDEVSLPVVAYNYLPTPQTITLSVTAADWFEIVPEAVPSTTEFAVSPLTRTITLAPNEVASLYFRIRALKAGTQTLTLSATSDAPDAADALQRSLVVLPDGECHDSVTNGTLTAAQLAELSITLPPHVIENSPHAVLKIFPSTFSQVLEGLESIFQMPSGCFEQTSSTTYPNVLALDYLHRTGKASPAVDATARKYIHLGYQRLLTFEVSSSGGFDWYGRGPANVALTAYGFMQFTDMARVYNVDPKLLDRTRRWLLAQRESDGTWHSTGLLHQGAPLARNPRLAATAYVTWSLVSADPNMPGLETTLAYLRANASSARDNPYVAALVANVLLTVNKSDATGRDLLSALESSCRFASDRKLAHWAVSEHTTFHGYGRSAEVETTALAALAMLAAGDRATTARAALAWLISVKDTRGTWHSTQATVLAFKALLAGTGTTVGDARERRLALTSNGKLLQEIRIPANHDDVLKTIELTPYLGPGATPFHLENLGGGDASGITYQLALRYHTGKGSPPDTTDAPAPTIALAVTYDRPMLTLADTLRAMATLRNSSTTALPMILLELPIPAGFVADTSSLDALVTAGTIDRYQLTPRQIVLYVRALPPTTSSTPPLSLSYALRPTMPVKLNAPSAGAYEYYNPHNRTISSAEITLEVTR